MKSYNLEIPHTRNQLGSESPKFTVVQLPTCQKLDHFGHALHLIRFGFGRFGIFKSGSVRFSLREPKKIRFGSVRFEGAEKNPVRFGSVRFGSV